MGNLRIKAKEIFKSKQNDKEVESKKREESLEKLIKSENDISKKIFTEKIQKEILNFQFNLLAAAEKGESLKIDIFETANTTVKSVITYLPISPKIITFLDDTNFDLISDDIITDDTLRNLYDLIIDNDIYPQWKICKSDKSKSNSILYLEVNPLISFKEKEAELQKKLETHRKIKEHALVLYTQNIKEIEKTDKKKKIKDFFLTFFLSLYISVVVLTVVTPAVGIFPIESMINSFGLIAVAWPYYIISDTGMFIFSLPVGLAVSLFSTFRRL